MYAVFASQTIYKLKQKALSSRKAIFDAYRRYFIMRSAVALLLLCFVSVAIQLAYPKDRTLPLSRLEGSGFVSFKSEAEIASKLTGLDRQNITIQVEDKTFNVSFTKIGIEVDEEATFRQLSHLSTGQRWVPFSILSASLQTQSVVKHIDGRKLADFSSNLAYYKKPVDASIQLEGTKLVVMPAKDGYRYHQSSIVKQLIGHQFGNYEPLAIVPEVLLPRIPTSLASDKTELMQKRIDTPLTVWASDKSMTIAPSVLASWIDIAVKPDHSTIELSFNKSRVANTLKVFAGVLETAAKPTISTMLNGSLAGSVNGKTGQSLRFDDLVKKVAESTDWSVRNISAEVDLIVPAQKTLRRYSRDSQGIQSLLNHWAATNGGQYYVSVRTLNGRIEAGINPYQHLPSDGINRLYVAHLIYGRLAANSLQETSSTSAGMSVVSCLEQMLVNSHKGCYYALGDIIGWSSNNSMLTAQGFEGTNLQRSGSSTTAHDTVEWLLKMQGSGIVSFSQTNAIVNKMTRHAQRSGIPAGSKGITVANTVDRQGNSWQEAALVLHPKNPYVISVMATGGGSSRPLSELAAEINQVLYE